MKEPSSPRKLEPSAETAPKSKQEAQQELIDALIKAKYPKEGNQPYGWVSWEDTSKPGVPIVMPGTTMKFIEREQYKVLNTDRKFNDVELQRQRKEKAKKFMVDNGFVFNPEDGTFSIRQLADPAIDGLPIKLREVADRLAFTYKKGADLSWFPAHVGGTLCIHGDFPATEDLPETPVDINTLDVANSGQKTLPKLPEQFQIKKILITQEQKDATPKEILTAAASNQAEYVIIA